MMFLWALLLPANIFSQTFLYPIKSNHQWGYITASGQLAVEPKYEAIGGENLPWHGTVGSDSGFKLVQAGGRLGLLDKERKEVLPTIYQDIRPLNHTLFAVQSDSLFHIVNNLGETIVQGTFEDVYFLERAVNTASQQVTEPIGRIATFSGRRFISAKKEGRWGVFSMQGQPVLPTAYHAVQWYDTGEGFFKVKTVPGDTLWGLVNCRNRPLLPEKYADIMVANSNCFLGRKPFELWEAYDSLGQRLLEPVWYSALPLNERFVSLQTQNFRSVLFSMQQRDTLPKPEQYKRFFPLDEKYVLAQNSTGNSSRDSIEGRGLVLLDSMGSVVKIPWFRNLKPASDSTYLAERNGGWGIFSLRRGIVLPCRYDHIGGYHCGVALLQKNGAFGFMDASMKEAVPPYFQRIIQEDSLLKAYYEDTLTVFKINEKNEVFIQQSVGNVRTLRVGKGSRNFAEAKIQQSQRRGEGILEDDSPSPFTSYVEGSRWEWRRDSRTRLHGLFEKSGEAWVAVPARQQRYRHVSSLPQPAALSLVYEPIPLPVERTGLAEVLPDSLYRSALFSHASGEVFTPAEMFGLRGQDFLRRLPYAAFIALDGSMGLVKKTGEQAKGSDGKPLRFAYIGEFFEGRARVCTYGQLAMAEEAKDDKSGVIKTLPLLRKFGIQSTLSFSQISFGTIFLDSLGGKKPVWGIIDTLGKFVVEPGLDFVSDYYNGTATAQRGGLWGVLDRAGKVVLEFKYLSIQPYFGYWKVGEKSSLSLLFNERGHERAAGNYRRQRSFSEGLCAVQSDSLWGFINKEGLEVVPCRFRHVRDFSEGLAAVRLDSLGWAFIDTSGAVIFEASKAVGAEVTEISDFHAGLAWFKSGDRYGYLDRAGGVKIAAQFSKAFDFQGGVARAVQQRKTGIIDASGQWLLKPERFVRILPFDGWGMAQAEEVFKGKVCLLDQRGRVLTPTKYRQVEPFSEGFAAASDERGWGLLDRKGRAIIPLQYERAGQVSEGLVAMRSASGWQYFDTLGQQAFKGQFATAGLFRLGVAEVQAHQHDPESRHVIDRWGKKLRFGQGVTFQFLSEGIFGLHSQEGSGQGSRKVHFYYGDAAGRVRFGQYFQEIKPFYGGSAFVKRSHRWGLLNRHGLWLVEPKYPFATQQADGTLAVRLPILFGILDREGKVVVPTACDRIEWIEGGVFRLEMGEKIGYVRGDGSSIWEMRN